MNIAYFTNIYLPAINGVVRSVQSFRQSLTELGHNVFVFAQEGNYEDEEPFIFRYPSISLPGSADIATAIPISPFVNWLLPSLKLDVIHTHHPTLLGQAAEEKARELNAPLVFTFHTRYRDYSHYFPFSQEAIQEFIKSAIDLWLRDYMRKCHHIVVPSESMREILTDYYGLNSRYTVIPTGIDIEPYARADGSAIRRKYGLGKAPVMVSVGRLAEEKNWELLLEAAAQAIARHPDLKVLIVGEGPAHKKLVKLAENLNIASSVIFTGRVPFQEVPSYLRAADFFGFASRTETQGIVTLEALAAGLPVVAVDASGTRDIVQNGRQGWLVPEDASALAEAIGRLLSDPKAREDFSTSALARAKDFSKDIVSKRMLEVYEQAIEDKKAGKFVEIRR